MRIAVVVSTFPPYRGGIGNAAYNLARILAKDNEVVVFAPKHKQEVADSENEFKVEKIKPCLQLGHGALLTQLLWKLKHFDFIYLHYPFFGSAEAVWLFKLLHPKTKLVIHYHMDNPGFSFLFKILSLPSLMVRKNLFKIADKIICSSLDYVQNSDILDLYEKMPNKFVDMPYGVDVNKFRVLPEQEVQKIKDRHGVRGGEKVVLFVGGLDKAHYFKGVGNLIKAFASVETHGYASKIKLIIVGKGELQKDYQQLATELDVGEKVIFADNVSNDELPVYYNLADVFVLPSIDKSEAFGIVLVEAMACGTPVIASDLAGVRKVFKDREQGLLVKVGDIEDLTEKLKQVLQNDNLRERMGQAARELAEEKYDWEEGLSRVHHGIGEKIENIFS